MNPTDKPIKVMLPNNKPGRKPKKTPEELEAMSKAVQLRVILGKNIDEIALEFKTNKKEVIRRLGEARAAGGALEIAQELVANRLLPKAVAVMDAALNGEEIPKHTMDAAKDVLFGTNTLKKKDESTVNVNLSPLEAYRKERMERQQMETIIDVVPEREPLVLKEAENE